MIVDSSALVAVLEGEGPAQRLLEALVAAPVVRMSAATYVECAVVVDRRSSPATRRRFDELLHVLGVEVVPLTVEHALLAREAYRDFGQGTGSPARLNLGDCYSYALAAESGEPLLFVGDDFTHTDLVAAAY
ncbi:ribonuclease VapC [Kytococcus aerolatus]|uniref:Ribonuclease VapC n=1 Tax=Kytococcus aerolatus TaxID=592308 RepID=A0A212TBR3_9MICO|nr:type II toxin-antitoxin system VapC family toxin [Kytococcus aerolatus]SNC63462.1 ribonuclease VapC [Kytococcus aerolatus]